MREGQPVLSAARCPHCERDQRECWYLYGNRIDGQDSRACVIQCEHCGKDFFNELDYASCNYSVLDDDGNVDQARLQGYKERYGYVTKDSIRKKRKRWTR